MSFWAYNLLLFPVYKDFLQHGLIEEVDAESLSYELVKYEKLPFPLLFSYFLGFSSIAAITAIYFGDYSFSFVLVVCYVLIGVTITYVFFTIRRIPFIISRVLQKIKLTHQMIKQRERITFGLGFSISYPQRKYKLRVCCMLRKFIKVLNSISFEMARDDEKKKLLSNFYSKEMVELLEADIDEYSNFIAGGGLSTLINLSSLQTSELCRLYLLWLSNLSVEHFPSFFKTSRCIVLQLQAVENNISALNINELQVIHTKNPKSKLSSSVEPSEAVFLALQTISSSILYQELTPDAARLAVHKVLSMKWFNAETTATDQNSLEEELIEDMSSRPTPLPEQPSMVDQVFEAIAETNKSAPRDYEEHLSIGDAALAASLMGELKAALGCRSKEFESRERKALAHFYGITEEELLKREMNEKRLQEEKEKLQSSEDKEITDYLPRRNPFLNNEILQALAKRGPVKETILGDTNDDE